MIPANPLAVAWARVGARGYLIAAGEIEDPVGYFVEIATDFSKQMTIGRLAIQDAVDALQHLAARSGLVADYGQDAVQSWMSAAFSTQSIERVAA